MFRRFHEKLREREEGFTLIELLVVILIIAILAAIAIPVFLAQRNKGYKSQAQSAVKNMATAEESFATANNGVYANTLAQLQGEGFRAGPVTPSIIYPTNTSTSDGYCLKAVSNGQSSWYASDVGAPQDTACTGPGG